LYFSLNHVHVFITFFLLFICRIAFQPRDRWCQPSRRSSRSSQGVVLRAFRQ
jgi:hypothetical protein